MDNAKSLWEIVERDLHQKTGSGYAMALIDAHKLLCYTLKTKGFHSSDIEKQLFWADIKLEKKADLKKAIEKRNEIIQEKDFDLSTFELEDYIAAYKNAYTKVIQSEDASFRRRLEIFLEKPRIKKLFKKTVPMLVAGVITIKLISSTSTGESLGREIVKANDVVFNWLLYLMFFVLGAGFFVVLLLLLFDRNKNVKILEED